MRVALRRHLFRLISERRPGAAKLQYFCTDLYRKTMIAILYFYRILTLFHSSSVFFSHLTAIVASCFDINTGVCGTWIRTNSWVHPPRLNNVTNLQGIRFLNSSDRPVSISGLDISQVYITLWNFRSSTTASDLDMHP